MLFSVIARIRKALPEWTSLLCAAFMLGVVPLLFHNAFFDINRFKVKAVCLVMPVLAAAVAFSARKDRLKRPGRSSRMLMLLFLTACVLSCVRAGFTPSMLDGSEGRYCGLVFMLCCGAAFFVIGAGESGARLLVPAALCASAVALLGLVNAMGLDPLGFYARIQKGQETVYLSTIGHFDFFGTYLIMLFPLAGGLFVYDRNGKRRALGLFCAAVMALGAMASRTDSALIGLHLGCVGLLAVSGGSLMQMARALALWGLAAYALPAMGVLLRYSTFDVQLSGVPELLFELHMGELLGTVLLVLAALCWVRARRGGRAPGRKRLAVILLALCALAALLLLGAMVYFSAIAPQIPLGKAEGFLRFNDSWGSLRGFAWIRSLRAFADYGPAEKLLGAGMEQTLRVLTPYFDDPSMLRSGVFNDPHCQPLQMLLTCGLLGMTAFVLFYISVLIVFLRHADDDPLVCGVWAAMLAYSVVLMINVTQPILIAAYFSLCGLGMSALRARKAEGRTGR